ncbi:MAG: tetratricopeptide repeat protein [Planctomycetes bacterium]|nr:tetratricopeptide repeat protein [Planctomycetota bacterium]
MSAVIAVILAVAMASTALGGADPPEFAQGAERFDEARRYAEEHPEDREGIRTHFDEAVRIWEGLVARGIVSSNLLTNLGNAQHFAGREGQAVLAWRRALAIDPDDERARDALEAVRAALPMRRPAGAATALTRALFFWHYGTSLGARRAAFIVLWITGWLALILAVLRRGAWRALAAASLAISLIVLGSLVVEALGESDADGVILVSTQGRRGDGEAYTISHTQPFPPGTEVRIRETRGGWANIALPDGSDAWVPESSVARVIPPE